ncbi:MAG: hypothetical protein ACRD1R_21565 [Acidobacteriota bacterium]
MNYFSVGYPAKAYREVNHYLGCRLIQHAKRPSQRCYPKAKEHHILRALQATRPQVVENGKTGETYVDLVTSEGCRQLQPLAEHQSATRHPSPATYSTPLLLYCDSLASLLFCI